ncbi:MAG TPA: pyridoxamine 5'-phosphate oxidase family protein [Candidatus Limnocylindrales bacterium]|nr:pyridoxamine 5'-phosphate oxidase family protein [Candidatus Limnocylindrales bacterium]
MFETEAELAELQAMFDAHLERANPHMLGIVKPSRRLTAGQVVAYLTGTKHVAFATVTSSGAPRVSPLDALFIHGRFTMSTGGDATRIAHLRRNPACSAVHMDGDRVAIVANGTAEWITRDHPDHGEIHGAWLAEYGNDPYTWGRDIVFFRLEPRSMWAYAFHPDEFPELPLG